MNQHNGLRDAVSGALAKRRILILDDEVGMREGLRAALDSDPRLEVVRAGGNSSDGMRSFRALRIDLVLIDIPLRSRNGLDAIREIKRCPSRTKALVVTAEDSDERVRAALAAGADGYILKDASQSELLLAIDSVLTGKRFISPAVSARIVSRYLERRRVTSGRRDAPELLTPRERQVLQLIAEGLRNREIASHLLISVKTVEKHRANLMRKTGLHNAAALTGFAIKKGLVGDARHAR